MIPASIRDQLAAVLPPIQRITAVSGGDISRAFKLETSTGAWLLKTNANVPPDFFAAEADGLACLRAAQVFAVPTVLAVASDWIVIEWFETTQQYRAADLGENLARLHAVQQQHYGYHCANYIGSLPQINTEHHDWATFWRDARLVPQIQYADHAQRLNPKRARLLDALCNRVHELLAHQPAKSLLHGDLWHGNVITAPSGQPALIDPAVSYGDGETDLAFAALFGGFGHEFEQRYSAITPLPNEYLDRRPLYQLYWLLLHLTLFGEQYGASVDRILHRYVG